MQLKQSTIDSKIKLTALIIYCSCLCVFNTLGQGVVDTKMGYKKYLDIDFQQHLWGPFPLKVLQEDKKYKLWFNTGYKSTNWFNSPSDAAILASILKNNNIEIYMGTWCTDSQKWVPRFIKLWDEMNLDKNKIKLIGISSVKENGRYKTTPNKIEIGKYISNVPTIIFKVNNIELGRIVEQPISGLKQDIEQIIKSKKIEYRHKASYQIMKLLHKNQFSDVTEKQDQYIKQFGKMVEDYSELDELSLIYRYRNEKNKAIMIAKWNNTIFPDVQATQSRVKNTISYFDKKK